MVQKVRGLISRTGESIKGFSSDPINNLGFLIPMAICLTSIVTGIVTYIMFIVNGGYSSRLRKFTFGNNGVESTHDALIKYQAMTFGFNITLFCIRSKPSFSSGLLCNQEE